MGPKTEFEFKVRTVKWFGLLSALVLLLMIGLGFWYLDRIIGVSEAYKSEISFVQIMNQPNPPADLVTLGLEHDALAMRNKRTVSALYMRAYSQFLAIIAGSILALLGAVFVLARVDSVDTKSETTWGSIKWLFSTASPGIVVVTIGALLIGGVVVISGEKITATDGAVFIGSTTRTSSDAVDETAMNSDLEKIRAKWGMSE